MSRVLLSITGSVAAAIGSIALLVPASLLAAKGVGSIELATVAMTRTVGVALLGVAALNLACRDLPPSPTLTRVLGANALLQLALLPLDPYAWAVGAFGGLGSFVPNTVLHAVLGAVFVRAWWRATSSSRPGSRGTFRPRTQGSS